MTDPRTLPARPPSEVEWEELLVKLEITPRALRLAAEDRGEEAVRPLLMEAVAVEARWGHRLECLRDGQTMPLDPDFAISVLDERPLTEHFRELRGRHFAWIQRRGLEVWEWRSGTDEGGTVTAYQALQAMVLGDAELLARIRRGDTEG